jgi:flagellar hook-length control protein FliK
MMALLTVTAAATPSLTSPTGDSGSDSSADETANDFAALLADAAVGSAHRSDSNPRSHNTACADQSDNDPSGSDSAGSKLDSTGAGTGTDTDVKAVTKTGEKSVQPMSPTDLSTAAALSGLLTSIPAPPVAASESGPILSGQRAATAGESVIVTSADGLVSGSTADSAPARPGSLIGGRTGAIAGCGPSGSVASVDGLSIDSLAAGDVSPIALAKTGLADAGLSASGFTLNGSTTAASTTDDTTTGGTTARDTTTGGTTGQAMAEAAAAMSAINGTIQTASQAATVDSTLLASSSLAEIRPSTIATMSSAVSPTTSPATPASAAGQGTTGFRTVLAAHGGRDRHSADHATANSVTGAASAGNSATHTAGVGLPMTVSPDVNALAATTVAGTQATATSASNTSAAPSTSTTPTAVYQQLAGPVLEMRAHGDGLHRVSLELHPAELGTVNVEVRLHSGEMSIAITSGSDATRDTIRAALPQLHKELASAGLGGVAVSVDSGSAGTTSDQGGRANTPIPQPNPYGHDRAVETIAPVPDPRTSRASSLATSGIDRWL